MRKQQARLLRERGLERLRRDEGVAVAVAPDPGSHGKKGRQPRLRGEREARRERGLDFRVEPRQLGEKRQAEIVERVRDLVRDREPAEPEHRGEPELQHLAVQRASARRRVAVGREQARDLALGIEDRLALHLGRVRGEHRADARALEPRDDLRGRDARALRALERVGEAPRAPRRTRARVLAAAAMLLHVLGDVEQVREIAECAHHVQRLFDRERVELPLEVGLDLPRGARSAGLGLRAPEAHRSLADALDGLERSLPRLVADHLAEQPPEQPPVLAQPLFLGIVVAFHRPDSIGRT